MEIYLIRHAQSQNNVVDQAERLTDPDLTASGDQQARTLADFLYAQCVAAENYRIEKIYTSPMHRALRTAQIIADKLARPVEVWADLHEHGGIYDHRDHARLLPGKTRAQISAEFPDMIVPSDFPVEGWWNRGYETPEQAISRALVIWGTLKAQADSDSGIALITHSGVITHLLKAAFNMLPSPTVGFQTHNVSITRLTLSPDRVTLNFLNRLVE